MKPTIYSVWLVGLTGGLALLASPFLIRNFKWVFFQENTWQFVQVYGLFSGGMLVLFSWIFLRTNRKDSSLEGGLSYQIFNKLPNCVWVFSLANRKLELSNEMADSMYGTASFPDPFQHFQSQFFTSKIGAKVLDGENHTYRNVVMIDKFYEPRYVDLFTIPFTSRTHRMVLVMALDHSEVHRSLEEIRRLSESLQQQNQQLRAYSFRNSHNIRSQLANILGLIQLEEQGISGDALRMLKEAALRLDTEIQEMNRLLMDKDLKSKEVEQKQQTIVFVDDDKVQHMINKRILLKVNEKLKLVFFENPYEALNWLERNVADVILLDINMPEMDGWYFLTLMEQRGIKGDVKMLTSSLDPEDVEKSKDFKQVTGFIVKPLKDENIAEFLAV
ncbi:response regulator [Cyclobacterium xiamenense]|uniref:response regulator n=1 Tax=Cyclobacterium xiamenense TaxID=1297121 RepID=UPI0035D0C644